MSLARRLVLPIALAALVLPCAADAATWKVTGKTKQGPVSFRVVNKTNIYSTDFKATTRCGVFQVSERLYWYQTSSAFSFVSPEDDLAFYVYNFTGPDGGGYGWLRYRTDGCNSGKLKITLDKD